MNDLGVLTADVLENAGACRAHLIVFHQLFPLGFYPTKQNFKRAADASLSIYWAAKEFIKDNEMRSRIEDRINQLWFESLPFQERCGIAWMEEIEREMKRRKKCSKKR